MDMCYDGALVMPSSYAMMEEEEMCYVEGGGLSWKNIVDVGVGILAVVGAVNTILEAFRNAIKFGKAVRGFTESAFVKGVASKVSASIGRLTTWISGHMGAIACALGALLGFAGGYALGSYVAKRVFEHY